jgi:hypothetical protein
VVLDFGLTMKIESYDDMTAVTQMAFEYGGNGAIGIAYDLYHMYPEMSSKVKPEFLKGIQEGIRLCRDSNKAKVIADFVVSDLNL